VTMRVWIDLLSALLTIPLGCCHIKRFRRASRGGAAMARRRQEDRRADIASRGMCSAEVVAPPVGGHRGVPARGVVPERCHAAGAAVDARCDTPAQVRRAEHGAEIAVLWTFREPSLGRRGRRACMRNAERDFTPSYTRNCLPPKKLL
jgi:hypothetical protein